MDSLVLVSSCTVAEIRANKADCEPVNVAASSGIPDEMGLRPLAWRLLLGYLPPAKSEWSEILLEKRTSYVHFVNDFVVSPGLNAEEATHSSLLIDHPLNLNPRSQWQAYFKDNEVLLQIDKDVRRLYPAISFFQRATEFPNVNVVNGSISKLHYRVQSSGLTSSSLHNKGMGVQKLETRAPSTIMDYAVLPEGSEAHWEVVERILFIYAKLNPGQGYVQGMNEIIGPIYYAFATDPNLQWREHAEADSFFCFTLLMSEIRDFFIKTLDGSSSGIGQMMEQLMKLLFRFDSETHYKLQKLEIRPQYFCFRWITLLLSQEFELPDILRIWDSLFADENRFCFLLHLCCSMIILIRHDILSGDFSSCMHLLQVLLCLGSNR
ncbi:hypothetical protein QYM36_008784 [Artemia franciscana]|uniref:Rab-GAP TBC domain-containing protein n=1 Tax=Artemia franciscana TaxID=6661 RepID=A0AA88I1D8_ARTSF|nr:hypothetical protein QYM36_008784 [Artemia franciscana]